MVVLVTCLTSHPCTDLEDTPTSPNLKLSLSPQLHPNPLVASIYAHTIAHQLQSPLTSLRCNHLTALVDMVELILRSPKCNQHQSARTYLAMAICQVILTTCLGSTTISLPQQSQQSNPNLNRHQPAQETVEFALAVVVHNNRRCNRLLSVLLVVVEQSPSHSPSLSLVIRCTEVTLTRCKCNTNKSCLVCLEAQDKLIRCKCSIRCIMDHMGPLPVLLSPSHRM